MAQRVAPSPVLMADPVDRTPSPRHSPPAVSQTDSRHGSPQTKRPLSPQDGLMRGAPSKRPSSPQDGQMEDAAEPKKRRVVLSYEDLDPAIRVRVLDYRPAVVDKRELLTELQLAHLLMSLDHFEIRDAVDLEHKAVQVICLGAVHGVWPDQPWAPPNCKKSGARSPEIGGASLSGLEAAGSSTSANGGLLALARSAADSLLSRAPMCRSILASNSVHRAAASAITLLCTCSTSWASLPHSAFSSITVWPTAPFRASNLISSSSISESAMSWSLLMLALQKKTQDR
ncbi:uncharacterized protein LOC124463755 [Hypomesus transpacificus]|uniref:uncharacterized protein LOC124463751 n=1 Tax=Hypomesus transpacificus TaxID=137520 RepID=UPI001F076535|nr:uncharacterized protein LOC124463751 [Hypomesus transpacificus]XP_046871492.1 uncharacterized protein LOC124463753 [Hypomesus transpacificus]XP_046871495.1 uncharacterized protein LOC124463755 [Hypomesus transpacificus]